MADFINYNDTTPAAPVGHINVKWQKDAASNVSAYVPEASGTTIMVDGEEVE